MMFCEADTGAFHGPAQNGGDVCMHDTPYVTYVYGGGDAYLQYDVHAAEEDCTMPPYLCED